MPDYGDDEFPPNAIGIMVTDLMNRLNDGIRLPPVMTAYRDFVLEHGDLLNCIEEPVKCNVKAARLRQEGNRLYVGKNYEEALKKYNESICYAEVGSDQVGLGYANRSAVYYEQGEYEFALLNIRLAKGHNYPEKMMEKLETREKNCWQKIDEGHAKDNVPCPRMGINVEVNPKIPFLAKGIEMKQYPGSGRGLVAKRNFKTGDVIMDEKAILNVVATSFKYLYCNHCGISNQHSLIPCPNCVFYMYCSEECLAEDKRFYHRFECGFGAQEENTSFQASTMSPKLFFRALTLFNDDLDQMMKYCEKNAFVGSNPLTLDYTKYDPMQEFKMLHEAKLPASPLIEYTFKLCAALNYVVLMKRPSVQSLVRSNTHKRFFLNCLYHYQRITSYFTWESNSLTELKTSGLLSIGGLINHSCDPNAVIHYECGRLKCVIIRPVRKGEQITNSLGPAWFILGGQKASELSFKCQCTVCRYGSVDDWMKTAKPLPDSASNDLLLCLQVMSNSKANDAAKLNAFQQIFQRYAQYLPNLDMIFHVKLYLDLLKTAINDEIEKLNRAKAVAAIS